MAYKSVYRVSNFKYGMANSKDAEHTIKKSNGYFVTVPHVGLEDWSFLAVFNDRHSPFVSEHKSKQLIKSVLNADKKLFNGLANGSLSLNKNETELILRTAIQKALDETDMNRSDPMFAMSTLAACLISPTHIYLIYCGDLDGLLVAENQINALHKNKANNVSTSRAEIHVYGRTAKDEFIALGNDNFWQVTGRSENLKDFTQVQLQKTENLSNMCRDILEVNYFHKVYIHTLFLF